MYRNNLIWWIPEKIGLLGIIASAIIKLHNLKIGEDVWEFVFEVSLVLIVVTYGFEHLFVRGDDNEN